jgi:PKHD-type hydroxylase
MLENMPDNNGTGIQENNHIWCPKVLPGLFSAVECNRILDMSRQFPIRESLLGAGEDSGRMDLYTRTSRVRWVQVAAETAWVYERVRDAALYVNQFYQFDLSGCMPIQVTEYPVGGHYNWHIDIGEGEPSKRKLSISVQLSDPEGYQGGDLEFLDEAVNDQQKFRMQGSAIIFPPYLAHRVGIVTKGVRWSLIAWFGGPPFR